MYIIGHRGACGYEPENTLASFKKARDLGVSMVELDVYTLKDGETVVIHDDTVDRTTDGTGYVMDHSFAEIRALDAGNDSTIPTLEEVLDLMVDVQINIELKGSGTAKPVAEIISGYVENNGRSYDDFLVSSFNHPELRKYRDLQKEVRVGALMVGVPETYAQFAQDLGAYSVNLSIEFIDEIFVQDAHDRDLKVFVFTVNEQNDFEKMKSLGVDGIFCNYPDRYLQSQSLL